LPNVLSLFTLQLTIQPTHEHHWVKVSTEGQKDASTYLLTQMTGRFYIMRLSEPNQVDLKSCASLRCKFRQSDYWWLEGTRTPLSRESTAVRKTEKSFEALIDTACPSYPELLAGIETKAATVTQPG